MRAAARRICLAVSAVLVTCAAPQRIIPHIAPSVGANGRGALVYLAVADERPASKSHSRTELAPLLHDSISRALWRIGFRPSDDPATPRRLEVDLLAAEYQTLRDRTRRLRTRATLEARTAYGEDRYSNLYVSEAEVVLPNVPSPTFASEQIDLIVWDALQKMFADEALFRPLTRD